MFSNSKDEFKGMDFHTSRETVKDSNATQLVVHASISGAKVPMAKFVSTKDMYLKDLEKNHKHLVDMNALCDSFVVLLDSYVSSDKLREGTYLRVMLAYEPFLDTYLDYKAFTEKVKSVTSDEGWV